jgi:pyroglutamyl-peptidase
LKILVTGFEPFGGEKLNPSWEVARLLDALDIPSAQMTATIVAVKLPCSFSASLAALNLALKMHQPQVVLALGQADGRSDISVERVAINVCDARIMDNDGQQPIDVPVIEGAPAAYFSTLPIKTMVQAMKAQGFAAGVSQTAGTFVCNQVFFGLQHALLGEPVYSGFVHVPLLPEQAAQRSGPSLPSMSAEVLRDGLVCALRAVMESIENDRADLKISGGTLS